MKTPVLKINPVNPDIPKIREAAELLNVGKLVVFPTDTVYGIGADVFNETAVQRIFDAKGRDYKKPLQILVSGKDDLKLVARVQLEELDDLVSEFWPGPLTLVIQAKDSFPSRVRCGLDTIGVRMPANSIALKLIEAFGAPVAATSANISGYPDPFNASDVVNHLDGKVDLIIDGGATPDNIPSTVLDISVSPPVILRQGKLSAGDLNKVLRSKIH